MDANEKDTDGKNLREDEHVQGLIPDPSQPPPDVVILVGFLGKSPTDGMWRLYLNANLNEYVELSEEDILRTQSLKTEVNPRGGTMVWVRRSTKLQYTRITSRQTQAEFLQGNITSAFLPRPDSSLGSASVIASVIVSIVSVLTAQICTDEALCLPSTLVDCPSENFFCSQVPQFCPSAVLNPCPGARVR